MKRRDLLKFIKTQLDIIKPVFPVAELYLKSENIPEISISRTMLISGAPKVEELQDFFTKFNYDHALPEDCVVFYQNSDEVLVSHLIDLDMKSLGLSWRGRIWKWDDLKEIRTQEEFDEKVFASYWRFIVVQNDNDYFARHEISPAYRNPGYSIGGFPDFRNGIVSFIEFLKSKRNSDQIDPEYDRVVIFSRKEPNRNFTRSVPSFFNGKNFITYGALENEIKRSGEDCVVDAIHESIMKQLTP